MPGNTGTGFMYNTSVWTPTLVTSTGLHASVWIPTLGSRVAHGAWLNFVFCQDCELSMLMMFIGSSVHWYLSSAVALKSSTFEITCLGVVKNENPFWHALYLYKLLLDCSSHALVSDFGDLKASTNKPMYYLHSSSTVMVCDMMVLPGEINLILCWPGLRPH